MTATVTRKRIEILVDTPLVPRIVALAGEAGITGYTLLPALSGVGATGAWSDDQVSGAASKVLFVTVASAERASDLLSRVSGLLDSYGLLLMMSDVAVVRGGKF